MEEQSQVHLLIPRTVEDGRYAEDVAIFAARRCRTTKSYQELWEEVTSYDEEKKRQFLQQVVFTDWAGDVLEMISLVYDVENIPVWLVVELLRHRLIARDFSLEQLSQRAINPSRLKVSIPDIKLRALVDKYIADVSELGREEKIPPEYLREAFPQGVLVNFCIAGNLRAFHHFFFMRSSELYQGKGGAHPKFMAIADQMQDLVKLHLPIVMETILPA